LSGRPAAARSARERKDASVPLAAARERKDASVPLGVARERKDASVPLGAAAAAGAPASPVAPGTGEPAARPRRMSKPQQEAIKGSVSDAATSYQGEGPMLGDNPLDAFAGSAAVSLELDYAPWQERRPEDAELKEKRPVQQVNAASPQVQGQAAGPARVTVPMSRSHGAGLWWLLPAAIALFFGLFLLLPGLFSAAPPDESEARAHEAESAATRGSSRVLQRQRVEVAPSARPEQRELLE
jgi:hypothetical protein